MKKKTVDEKLCHYSLIFRCYIFERGGNEC